VRVLFLFVFISVSWEPKTESPLKRQTPRVSYGAFAFNQSENK